MTTGKTGTEINPVTTGETGTDSNAVTMGVKKKAITVLKFPAQMRMKAAFFGKSNGCQRGDSCQCHGIEVAKNKLHVVVCAALHPQLSSGGRIPAKRLRIMLQISVSVLPNKQQGQGL